MNYKNINFLNNQNYIFGKSERKKLLSRFFIEIEIKNLKNIFKKIIKWAFNNQFIILISLIIINIIIFGGTNLLISILIMIIALLLSGSPIVLILIFLFGSQVIDFLEENRKIEISGIELLITKNVSKIKIITLYFTIYIFLIYFIYINIDAFYLYVNYQLDVVFYKFLMIIFIPIFIILTLLALLWYMFEIINFLSKIINYLFPNKIKKIFFFPFYINYFSLLILPFLIIYFLFYTIFKIIYIYFFYRNKKNLNTLKLDIKTNLFNKFQNIKNNYFSNQYYIVKYQNKNYIDKINIKYIKILIIIFIIIYSIYSIFIFIDTYNSVKGKTIGNNWKDSLNPIIKIY